MPHLTPADLLTLEAYSKARNEFRAKVMAHKQHRRLGLGEHVTLMFEDELTIRYQVQEMLRAEKLFEEADIQGELDAYNPLIPDGSNWKATMMIEYTDGAERERKLEKLVGIEHRVWAQAEGFGPVYAIANEDLERATEKKTSAVHFLRFELPSAVVAALRGGAPMRLGIDHPEYRADALVSDGVRQALLTDLVG